MRLLVAISLLVAVLMTNGLLCAQVAENLESQSSHPCCPKPEPVRSCCSLTAPRALVSKALLDAVPAPIAAPVVEAGHPPVPHATYLAADPHPPVNLNILLAVLRL